MSAPPRIPGLGPGSWAWVPRGDGSGSSCQPRTPDPPRRKKGKVPTRKGKGKSRGKAPEPRKSAPELRKRNRPGKKQRERRKYARLRLEGRAPQQQAQACEGSPPSLLRTLRTPPADRPLRHGDPSPSPPSEDEDDGEGEGDCAEEETLADDPTVTPPGTPAPSEVYQLALQSRCGRFLCLLLSNSLSSALQVFPVLSPSTTKSVYVCVCI